MAQVENEELLLYGTGHFVGFFSISGILRHNVAGATDTTALDAIEQMRMSALTDQEIGHVAIEWAVPYRTYSLRETHCAHHFDA
jgi:hypothetical protein